MLLTALTVVACALALTEGAAVPRSLQEARASHADTMVPVARGGMAGMGGFGCLFLNSFYVYRPTYNIIVPYPHCMSPPPPPPPHAATSKPNSVAQRYVTAEQLDRKLDAKFAELKGTMVYISVPSLDFSTKLLTAPQIYICCPSTEFLKGITQEAKPTSHTGIHSDSQTVCDCYLQLLDTADFQWFCSSQDCECV